MTCYTIHYTIHYSVWSGISAHNLTSLKRDAWCAFPVCIGLSHVHAVDHGHKNTYVLTPSAVYYALLYCSKYGFTVDDMPKVSGRSIVKHYIHRADPAVIVRVRMLLELIFIRNGLFYLNMPDSDIQFLISQLCIM